MAINTVAAGTTTYIPPTFLTTQVSGGSGATTILLPNMAAVIAAGMVGQIYSIADLNGIAATSNITITAVGSALIGSTKTISLATNNGTSYLLPNGTNWSQAIFVYNGVVVTANTTFTAGQTMLVVNKTTGSATTISMPTAPVPWLPYIIKDGKGDAATNNITITSTTGTFDGATTLVMSTNYQAITVVYNGTNWNRV